MECFEKNTLKINIASYTIGWCAIERNDGEVNP
jgi:hypothetical protein